METIRLCAVGIPTVGTPCSRGIFKVSEFKRTNVFSSQVLRSPLECPRRSGAQKTFARDLFSLAGVGDHSRTGTLANWTLK